MTCSMTQPSKRHTWVVSSKSVKNKRQASRLAFLLGKMLTIA